MGEDMVRVREREGERQRERERESRELESCTFSNIEHGVHTPKSSTRAIHPLCTYPAQFHKIP